MPLTDFQRGVSKLLAQNKSPDSYLAGGAALHLEPSSKRYSNDLDFFHDSEKRVNESFKADRALLEKEGYLVEVQNLFPSFIRAAVSKGEDITKVEWVHDTSWRFLPVIKDKIVGYRLHPVDLGINKLLALVGRNEARDFLDMIEICKEVLPLGALIWAATGKDPGYSPNLLLEILKRKGSYRAEDFKHLNLTTEPNLKELKKSWLLFLKEAEEFINARPVEEIGCLYWSTEGKRFIAPTDNQKLDNVQVHYGRPGGILPNVID